MNLKRVIIDVLIFISILTLPWWLYLILLISLTIYFQFYLEVLFFGFLFDTLYGQNHIGLIISVVFLGLVMFAKERIRT